MCQIDFLALDTAILAYIEGKPFHSLHYPAKTQMETIPADTACCAASKN
jgi:hypothetical protein